MMLAVSLPSNLIIMTVIYWICTGIGMGAFAQWMLARRRRKRYDALKPGEKVWLTTLAHAQRD